MEERKFTRTTALIKKELDNRTVMDQQNAFLDQFEKCANATKACRLAKVSRSSLYHVWMNDADFKKAYEASQRIAAKVLEDEMVRRAHEGVVRPIYQGGKKVGSVREYSDTLMIVLAKAHDPERFKDRNWTELSGKGGKPIAMSGNITHNVFFKNSKEGAEQPTDQQEGGGDE